MTRMQEAMGAMAGENAVVVDLGASGLKTGPNRDAVSTLRLGAGVKPLTDAELKAKPSLG